MTSPVIANSLLRLDGVTGLPPSPFERPNDKMDFFVLELGVHGDVDGWCIRTVKALGKHGASLRQMSAEGAEATLFVKTASSTPVLRLDRTFLSVLAGAGISLEHYHESAS